MKKRIEDLEEEIKNLKKWYKNHSNLIALGVLLLSILNFIYLIDPFKPQLNLDVSTRMENNETVVVTITNTEHEAVVYALLSMGEMSKSCTPYKDLEFIYLISLGWTRTYVCPLEGFEFSMVIKGEGYKDQKIFLTSP